MSYSIFHKKIWKYELKRLLLRLKILQILKQIKFMLNQYETVFIVTPVLSDIQMKEAVQKFKDLLLAEGCEILKEEDWGLRKLAYPIQKKSTGFYALFEFKGEGSVIEKLETEYRRDERIIRFLTFKMDKYAIEYSQKRAQKQNESKKEE